MRRAGIGRFGPEPRPLEQRFWPKVQKSDGCWLWIAGGDSETGYGRIRAGGRGTTQLLAHRAAWELTNGPVPDGLWVLHHCDTPRCVRPDHLFLGDHADNMGRRAPSDPSHLVAMCYGANVGVPSKDNRERCREYLRSVEGARVSA